MNKNIFLGIVTNDTFRLYDGDNYHKEKDAFGIDEEVLGETSLQFRNIDIKFRGKTYSTTRSYFKHFAKPLDLFNGRNMLFLSKKYFGQNTADLWELYDKYHKLGEKDIYNAFPNGWSMDAYNEWYDAVKIVEAWKQRIKRLENK